MPARKGKKKEGNGSAGGPRPVDDKEVTPTTQLLPVKLSPEKLRAAKVELQSTVQDETDENKQHAEATTRPKGRIKQLEAEIVQAGHASDPEKGGERVANLMLEKERILGEIGELKSRHDLNMAVIQARQNKLLRIVQSGVDYASVDCQIVKDFGENSLTITRLDTGDVLEVRALEGDERQMPLVSSEPQDEEAPSPDESQEQSETVTV